MKFFTGLLICFSVATFQGVLLGQQASNGSATIVPQLVSFSGVALDAQGKPVSGIAGITFSIYSEQYNGAPLWMETQNVMADSQGNYSVQLGASKPHGLPLELFASGEARWLGARVEGAEEQPRVLLVSVPYALKAADAQTLGGLPPSAFLLAAQSAAVSAAGSQSSIAGSNASTPGSTPAVGGSGTANYIPLWTDSADLGNSILYQTGTGSSARVGINITSPLFTLDVKGTELVRGLFELATLGYATSSKAYNSNALNLESSAFNSGTGKYTLNHFQWQAEPTGNNTSTPGATLNLLYGTDPNLVTETGLSINSQGIFTFAPGQTFPGGSGTVTSVGLSAPSSDFTVSGSPVTSSGTLGLNWNVAPTNTDIPNAIVKRDPNGAFSSGEITATATDTNPALTANSTNSFGFGVSGYGTATGVVGSGGFGVAGYGTNTGVLGTGTNSTGVQGTGGITGVIGYGSIYGLYGSTSGTGGAYGVYGTSTSSATGIGVYGSSTVTGTGVYGIIGSPSGMTGTSAAVWGDTATGVAGVYGSNTPNNFLGYGVVGQSGASGMTELGSAGVWGDGGNGSAGILATASVGVALWAVNDSSDDYPTAGIYSARTETGVTNWAFAAGSPGDWGQGTPTCSIDNKGDLYCGGTKSAVVPASNNRQVALYAVESPENWFEDFGSGQLVDGAATVTLDPTFAETVNMKLDYHVFLTPNGDCKGLYVEQKGAGSFEVRELGSGTSNVAFDYRIVAKRLGYESKRLEDMRERLEPIRASSQWVRARAAKAKRAAAN